MMYADVDVVFLKFCSLQFGADTVCSLQPRAAPRPHVRRRCPVSCCVYAWCMGPV